MRHFALLFIVILWPLATLAKTPGASLHVNKDPIVGLWMTEDHDAVVEFYDCTSKICGRFHWMENGEDGKPPVDEHNHDEGKRQRSLCQMQFIGDFQGDGQGHYVDGWIYNPQDGWNYNAEMTLTGKNTLDLHGYVLLPILGRSQTWTRVPAYKSCKAEQP